MEKPKSYYCTAGLMAFVVVPIVLSVVSFAPVLGLNFLGPYGMFISPILVLALCWAIYATQAQFPQKASETYFPIALAHCYYLLVWVLLYGLSGYFLEGSPFHPLLVVLTLPYAALHLFMAFLGTGSIILPLVIGLSAVLATFSIMVVRALRKHKVTVDKKVWLYVLVFALLAAVAVFQLADRSRIFISPDYQVERVNDEVSFYDYRPFTPDNLLERLDEPATISISGNYPILDGATAAYPVYAAIAQELYEGLSDRTVIDYVGCTKTDVAYERLINGEIDVFFGAQPSAEQVAMAEERGLEFALTPIAREAFVFFVNSNNPVDNLTLEQIQDIYQRKITNWQPLGGNDEAIMAFQRPVNSGSQTIMLAKVMGDKVMAAPLQEESAQGMGGIMKEVATYRNYSSAIGYSFRFYATGMNPNENLKLLAIEGIEPSKESIRNGTYPFTVEVYAVTVGAQSENTKKLLEWTLSEQGQGFIEKCGYVRL
ncbi:MAG: substrate-binding domain-containing protein [Coriobacteriia bacterium]|nr:substrate-binding domain-containing protein [Coriobacteriia bacterium]